MKNHPKVVVLGLGYIGYELCKIYSYENAIVIDNQFNPTRVSDISEMGVRFYQRDIFDTKDLIKDADILYNTISITSVPQCKKDSNELIDKLIYKIGVEGNHYVMDNISDVCRLVFLSTHVIYEGCNKKDIKENDNPCPVLAYSISKRLSEIDLIQSSKNWVIGRLGSSFGWNPAIRMPIVTNIFAKMAAIDKKIKLTNKNCYKPVAGTEDIARALVYIAELNNEKEIYHIVKDNIKVGDIAAICKNCVPDLEIEDSGGDNEGYTLSNNKLLRIGYKFRQTIDAEIYKMIKRWSV